MSTISSILSTLELATNSPTLAADLVELRSRGIKIHWVGSFCRAFATSFPPTVHVSYRCSSQAKLRVLAHECAHVLLHSLPLPLPTGWTEEQFVAACLDCETTALVHEAVVCEELLAAGVLVDSYEAVRLYREGGAAALRAAVGDMITSTTGQTYTTYYRQMFRSLPAQETSI